MIPATYILNALTRNEIIAIYAYFDIDFEVYYGGESAPGTSIEKGDALCYANKYVLIDMLVNRKFDKISYVDICYKRAPLTTKSRVLYGQFCRANIFCRRIMKKLDVKFNEAAFAVAHKHWTKRTPLLYEELPVLVNVMEKIISIKVSREFALKKFEEFVDSLDSDDSNLN